MAKKKSKTDKRMELSIRIPLPKKAEKSHGDKTKYNRKRKNQKKNHLAGDLEEF